MNKEGHHMMITDLFHQKRVIKCMHPITEPYFTQSQIWLD